MRLVQRQTTAGSTCTQPTSSWTGATAKVIFMLLPQCGHSRISSERVCEGSTAVRCELSPLLAGHVSAIRRSRRCCDWISLFPSFLPSFFPTFFPSFFLCNCWPGNPHCSFVSPFPQYRSCHNSRHWLKVKLKILTEEKKQDKMHFVSRSFPSSEKYMTRHHIRASMTYSKQRNERLRGDTWERRLWPQRVWMKADSANKSEHGASKVPYLYP